MSHPSSPVAPGAHIEVRDAVWRVEKVDLTSDGTHAWRCVGISGMVQDQDAIFLEAFEPRWRLLDPAETALVNDDSKGHLAGRLYLEALLRDVSPVQSIIHRLRRTPRRGLRPRWRRPPLHRDLPRPRR